MADTSKASPDAHTKTDAPQKAPWWKSLLLRRWLAILIVASLALHCLVFVLVRKSGAKAAAAEPEYTVGSFAFIAGGGDEARHTPGKFALHIRFVDDLDKQARTRIITHQFRVREAVEELLRKAQGLDFDEPAMVRLKHQIQQRIDDAIDLRAVAEVIITDMNIEPPIAAAQPAPHPVVATQPTAQVARPGEDQ